MSGAPDPHLLAKQMTPRRRRRKLADKRPTERIIGPAAGAATLTALLELGLPPLWATVLAAIATIAPEVVSRTVDAIDQRRAERESGR